jgi:hypothetical protein
MSEKKTFIAPNESFSLILPQDWDEYDDGEDYTFAFFNAKSWTGNLRITPFYWTKADKTSQEFIQDELAVNIDAVKITLGSFDCVHYKKTVEQNGENLVIYYWIAEKGDNIFICSFTIDKEQELQKKNSEALKTVQDIISSINMR